jgi:hypothetical protein
MKRAFGPGHLKRITTGHFEGDDAMSPASMSPASMGMTSGCNCGSYYQMKRAFGPRAI